MPLGSVYKVYQSDMTTVWYTTFIPSALLHPSSPSAPLSALKGPMFRSQLGSFVLWLCLDSDQHRRVRNILFPPSWRWLPATLEGCHLSSQSCQPFLTPSDMGCCSPPRKNSMIVCFRDWDLPAPFYKVPSLKHSPNAQFESAIHFLL